MENREPVIITQDPKEGIAKKVAYGVYALYLLNLACPGIFIVGVIFAYIFENDAHLILKSHYQFLIRSFWIGLLYFSVAGILVFVLIGMVLVPLCMIWWVIRMVKGIKTLMRDEPIANPKTWWF